jgi:hypothetical protein
LLWGGASASSSNAEMRAYYVDPGSSTHQAGKIIAIDVVGMRVHKFIDYPEPCSIECFLFSLLFSSLKSLPNCTRDIFINRQNSNRDLCINRDD